MKMVIIIIIIIIIADKVDELFVEVIIPVSVHTTQWSRTLSETLVAPHPNKKFLAFCCIQGIITVFTKARHFPYPETDKSSPSSSILFL